MQQLLLRTLEGLVRLVQLAHRIHHGRLEPFLATRPDRLNKGTPRRLRLRICWPPCQSMSNSTSLPRSSASITGARGEPYSCSHLAAVLGPTFSTPGTLSMASPTRVW